MYINKYYKCLALVVSLVNSSLFFSSAALANEVSNRFLSTHSGWSVGIHYGKAVKQSVRNGEAFLPFTWESEGYSLVSVGLRKEVSQVWKHSRIFTELNLSNITGKESYEEISLTPTITWDTFPWDDVADTTIGLGVGLSYTSIAAKLDDVGQRWLASMIFELEVQPAVWSNWSTFARVHHRSNAGGAFGDVNDVRGSNFPSLGVRYYF